jgi:hypothetical protein
MARKKYDYQEIPLGFVIVMLVLIPAITLMLAFKDRIVNDNPDASTVIVLNTSANQWQLPKQSDSDSGNNLTPTPKDLTLPSGFHQLKWGDSLEKLNHPVLVTDNEDNIQVAGYEVDANMHEVPQCYTQKGENLKLGMNHIDEIVYCFTNKQLSQVQVYRKIAYLPGYNDDNCNNLDCIASKDQTWNRIFVDYITKIYGTNAKDQNEYYQIVEDKFWQDNQGRNIYLKMDDMNTFTIGTDAYDNQSAQAIAIGMDKCNRATAEGNDSN